MNTVARMAVLDLRTVAAYRKQSLVIFAVVVVLLAKNPVVLLPALVLLVTPALAAYPFQVADKSGLETLYAVLPVPRRSVVLGHYTWALTAFAGTVAAGVPLALVIARVTGTALSGHDIGLMLSLGWVLFAVNIAVQFPLLIKFGYTRIGLLGTTVPLALVMVAAIRLHVSVQSLQDWLPVLWPAGVAVLAASVAVAVLSGPHRN